MAGKNGFKNKRTMAGSRTAVISVCALIIAILVNIGVQALPSTLTKIDTTSTELFSISEQTTQILKAVDRDVNVYIYAESGFEDQTVVDMVGRYKELSKHINIIYKDSMLYPEFYKTYTNDELDTSLTNLIVESELRSMVIKNDEIYVTEYDYTNYSSNSYYAGEPALTTAVDYVTLPDIPKFYALSGHGEVELSESAKSDLIKENVDYEKLSLLISGVVPEDASCLYIMSPTTDLTEQEKTAIMDYLKAGGKMLFVGNFAKNKLPNFAAVFEYYGVTAVDGIVVEGNTNKMMYGYPTYIIPTLVKHGTTEPLIDSTYNVMMPFSQGLDYNYSIRDSVATKALMSSSADSYSKVDGYAMTTTDKAEGDIDGSFALAVAIVEYLDVATAAEGEAADAAAEASQSPDASGSVPETEAQRKTQIIWFTSPYIMDETVIKLTSGANTDLFLNAVSWMCDKESSVSIRSKSTQMEYLVVPEMDTILWTGVFAVAMPLITLVIGTVVCLKRRKH